MPTSVRRLHTVFTVAAMLAWMASASLFLGAQAPDRAVVADSRISAAEVADLLVRNVAVIIDVRDDGMFKRGHLPGATLAPPDRWRETALSLANTRSVVVTYCSCPQEETSLRAVARFTELGVANVRALTGGYEGWAAAGRPVIKGDPLIPRIAAKA